MSLTNENYGISLTNEAWMGAGVEECGLRLLNYEALGWDNHHDITTIGFPPRGP